ncbi:urate hydroxylase PuuD [Iodidimonas sp. SYSU 1G8]|uniref:urate hydroxylase PuuD n=1 Tax=Iodidimonas sp. SYSU 1G8 TaxID=3133967 RepID=UPI0031FE6C96
MSKITDSLPATIIAGIILTILMVFAAQATIGASLGGWQGAPDHASSYTAFIVRWLHVISGVMWIGLLWYFNFVQIPTMPKIPDEHKPGVSKHIAPEALFWFRWGAMATLITGLLLAILSNYLVDALALKLGIGYGMWFAMIMWFNVWFIIWPAQKIALGLVDAPADQKPKAAARAKMFSRINTMLSIPMLYAMVGQSSNGFSM